MTTLLLLLSFLAHSESPRFALNLDGDKASVEFLAIGTPSAIRIKGELKENKKEALKGKLSLQNGLIQGDVVFFLSHLDTGIGLRDKHMKEKYLEVSKFPTARLEVTELRIPSYFQDGFTAEETFKGKFTLRDQTKNVEGRAFLSGNGKQIKARVEFQIHTSDYKITPPSFLQVVVADNVDVRAEAELLVTGN